MGCKNLTVVTDHKPLLGLFKDRDLNSVTNTRLQKFKQRTFRYNFKTQYCPGKWHRGPDAVSRNPVVSGFNIIAENPNDNKVSSIQEVESMVRATCYSICNDINEPSSSDENLITFKDIRNAASSDTEYSQLVAVVQEGFNQSHYKTLPALRQYYNIKNRLSIFNGVVLFDTRIVVPTRLRK